MARKFLTLPNLMTCYRFPAGLAMLWLLQRMDPANYPAGADGQTHYPVWIALTIAIVSFLTFISDYYDGKLARQNHDVSDFGKIMDPVADNMFFTLLMLGLALSGRFHVSVWFTVVMLYREAGVQILRRQAALKGVVLMAGWAGKVKTALQCVVMAILGFAVLFKDAGWLDIPEKWLIVTAWAASAFAAVGGLVSLGAYVAQLPQMIASQREAAKTENQPGAPGGNPPA